LREWNNRGEGEMSSECDIKMEVGWVEGEEVEEEGRER
jgi:hypothetical protein